MVDEAHFTESVHEITHSGSRGTNHFWKCFLAYLQDGGSGLDCSPKRASTNRIRANRFSPELRDLVDKVLFDSLNPRQQMRDEEFREGWVFMNLTNDGDPLHSRDH